MDVCNKPKIQPRMIYSLFKRDVTCPFHMHNNLEIIIVFNGELIMQINKEEYIIPQGHAVFLDSYEGHSFYTEQSNSCAIIEFLPEFCNEIYAPFYNWLRNHTIVNKCLKLPDEILNCIMFILPEDYENMTFYDTIPIHFFAILAPLLYAIMTTSECIESKTEDDSSFIRAVHYISENYDKKITRESVANKIGICPQSVSRVFSSKTQLTFTEYLQYVRINQSLRMLEKGETVTSAALSSGFDSIRTYNRVFKRQLGMSPTAYLKKHSIHSL